MSTKIQQITFFLTEFFPVKSSVFSSFLFFYCLFTSTIAGKCLFSLSTICSLAKPPHPQVIVYLIHIIQQCFKALELNEQLIYFPTFLERDLRKHIISYLIFLHIYSQSSSRGKKIFSACSGHLHRPSNWEPWFAPAVISCSYTGSWSAFETSGNSKQSHNCAWFVAFSEAVLSREERFLTLSLPHLLLFSCTYKSRK